MAGTRPARARSNTPLAVVLTDEVQCLPADPEFLGRNKQSRGTIEYIVSEEMRALGYRSSVMTYGPDPEQFAHDILERAPRIVFNLTEEVDGDRRLDASIAGLLQLLGVRFTGAGPRGLTIGRDKAMSKVLLRDAGVNVPRFCVIPPGGSAAATQLPPFPAVVKPVFGYGSDGISSKSVVHDERQLRVRAAVVHREFRQPAICEEYIHGREFLSFAVGNRALRFLPTVEITWKNRADGEPRLASYSIKHELHHRRRAGMRYRPALLTPQERVRLEHVTTVAYHVLEMRDYGKVDVIMDWKGDFYVIEGNPNPCLLSKWRSLGRWKTGYSFRHLVADVVRETLARRRR
jgi:D-alanine-D-alanine ligase